MSFGIKEEKLVSVEDRDLLKWVKVNKAKLEKFKLDTDLFANIVDRRLEDLDKDFERVEAAVELNKSKIEQNKTAFGTLGDIISKNAKGAKNAREQLAKAIKFAEDNQQKEITARMEAMRQNVEKSLEAKFTEKSLLLDYKEMQINKKGSEILKAQKDAYKKGKK
tara:strand:- start:11178 stop:11672 length:495 start_codon:yes stop_codon:yes gene_type:complete